MFSAGSVIFKNCLNKPLLQSINRFIFDSVGILGVPFDKGQRKSGVSEGPAMLRRCGLVEAIQSIGCKVIDHGDVEYDPAEFEGEENVVLRMNALEHVVACHEQVSAKVTKIINDGQFCLTLGGDHSLSVGSIDGHQKAKPDLAVLWVDAHADINTADTSPTGNVHGMPAALALKELLNDWPYIPGMRWQEPQLSVKNLAYIGLRDVDEGERDLLEKYGITAFGMEDILSLGIAEVVRLALLHIDPEQKRALHVSFDIDALDSIEAPSTGTSVRGGLTLREGLYIMEKCHSTGRLSAMDLVEVNPCIGNADEMSRTVDAAILLSKIACGYVRFKKSINRI